MNTLHKFMLAVEEKELKFRTSYTFTLLFSFDFNASHYIQGWLFVCF